MPFAYDPQNIFAKILRGEIPCHKIMEDDAALAFMDIMPRCEGHSLVIPKVPVRTILDIGADHLGALILRVQSVARAAVAATEADGVTIQQFNEAAGGQEVFHLHFHVLPRRNGVPLRAPGGPMADPGLLRTQAQMIAAALPR